MFPEKSSCVFPYILYSHTSFREKRLFDVPNVKKTKKNVSEIVVLENQNLSFSWNTKNIIFIKNICENLEYLDVHADIFLFFTYWFFKQLFHRHPGDELIGFFMVSCTIHINFVQATYCHLLIESYGCTRYNIISSMWCNNFLHMRNWIRNHVCVLCNLCLTLGRWDEMWNLELTLPHLHTQHMCSDGNTLTWTALARQ
jgi:hypothetical protein